MQISAVAPAPGRNAFGEHLQNGIKIAACQFAIGIGALHQVEKFGFAPIRALRWRGDAGRDYLLRQDVQGRGGDHQPVEFAAANSAH